MRIKRQRRKLRGKYSGNCLSCSAKWSKCWYIASTDNQGEWETRLGKIVTPGDDEVCFQCWDAKIRTSPKRKVHFKTYVDPCLEDSAVSPVKRGTNRQKRRALSDDFTFVHPSISLGQAQGDCGSQSCFQAGKFIESEMESSVYKGSVLCDEENAAILLSTAFHTIPQINNLSIGTKISNYDIVSLGGFCSGDNVKRCKVYNCSMCKQLKKRYTCDSPQIKCLEPASVILPIQAINIQLSPIFPQILPIYPPPLVATFAQPVIS